MANGIRIGVFAALAAAAWAAVSIAGHALAGGPERAQEAAAGLWGTDLGAAVEESQRSQRPIVAVFC